MQVIDFHFPNVQFCSYIHTNYPSRTPGILSHGSYTINYIANIIILSRVPICIVYSIARS